MCATDPKAKNKPNEDRPESTGRAYERLVEDLFMGESEEEDSEESDEDTE